MAVQQQLLLSRSKIIRGLGISKPFFVCIECIVRCDGWKTCKNQADLVTLKISVKSQAGFRKENTGHFLRLSGPYTEMILFVVRF